MDERTWIVDAANVIGARPDGWWRDRSGAALRLYRRLSMLYSDALYSDAQAAPAPVNPRLPAAMVLVLEGEARRGVAEIPQPARGRLVVVHACGSGDDAVINQIHRRPGPVLVITADRELRGRAQGLGAAVAGPGRLWELLGDAASP